MNPIVLLGLIATLWSLRNSRKEERKNFPPAVEQWDSEVQYASEKTGISAELLKAIISVESGGDPFARGSAGERGLMQLTEGAFMDSVSYNKMDSSLVFGLADNPKINVAVGAGYLKLLRDTCGKNIERYVRAYNRGCAGSRDGKGQEYLDKVREYL